MTGYANAIDDLVRDPDQDQPTIGTALYKEHSRNIVECSLRDSNQPIGVSTYRPLSEPLNEELRTAEALGHELRKAVRDEGRPNSQPSHLQLTKARLSGKLNTPPRPTPQWFASTPA